MIKIKSKKKPSLAKGRKERGKGKPSPKKLKPEMGKLPQPLNSFPEISFLICKHRKSQPKISPLICEQRCQRIKGCREYFDYIQPAMFERLEKREAREKGKGASIPVYEDSRDPGNSLPGGKTTRRRP
jgi:hypothetical protein